MDDEIDIEDLPLPRLYRQVAVIYPSLDAVEPHYSWSLSEEEHKKIVNDDPTSSINICFNSPSIILKSNRL